MLNQQCSNVISPRPQRTFEKKKDILKIHRKHSFVNIYFYDKCTSTLTTIGLGHNRTSNSNLGQVFEQIKHRLSTPKMQIER